MVNIGRPREHDRATAEALLCAAERLVTEGGPDALSVRAVADGADTTTRAVYSLFRSKQGLVDALATAAFETLTRALDDHPVSDDPAGDLVAIGIDVFRDFVLGHPSLFRVAFQRVAALTAQPDLVAARRETFRRLVHRFQLLHRAGRLGDTSPVTAAIEFNALCEGLANAELRGQVLSILPAGQERETWRHAIEVLLAGFHAARP